MASGIVSHPRRHAEWARIVRCRVPGQRGGGGGGGWGHARKETAKIVSRGGTTLSRGTKNKKGSRAYLAGAEKKQTIVMFAASVSGRRWNRYCKVGKEYSLL